jgi:hypothetical protein
MNLGLCYEKNGQTASAWTTYREAASLARDKGQAEREQTARDAFGRLEPLLLKVIISAAPPPDGSQVDVKIDGQPFPSGLFGAEAPMDPGTHQLTATGQGKKPFVTSFTVQAGPPATVTIPVLELAPEEPAAAPPPTSTPGAPAPEAEPKSDGHGQRMAAVILGGVGVAAVGVGSVFGLLANSSYSSSKNECNGDHCTQAGHDDRERAFGQATVATVGFAVGGAALIGGAIVWFTAPKAHTEQPVPPAVSFAPFVGPGIAGVGVGGRL